jgi:hypothetical protein
VMLSGGKDGIAVLLHLLRRLRELGVPHER